MSAFRSNPWRYRNHLSFVLHPDIDVYTPLCYAVPHKDSYELLLFAYSIRAPINIKYKLTYLWRARGHHRWEQRGEYRDRWSCHFSSLSVSFDRWPRKERKRTIRQACMPTAAFSACLPGCIPFSDYSISHFGTWTQFWISLFSSMDYVWNRELKSGTTSCIFLIKVNMSTWPTPTVGFCSKKVVHQTWVSKEKTRFLLRRKRLLSVTNFFWYGI